MPDGTVLTRPLGGFALRCNNFDLDKFKDGSPRRFASDLDVLDPAGKVLESKRIIVNDPLEHGGLTFYQASYQERPDQSHARMVISDPRSGESKAVDATPAAPFFLGDGRVRYTVVDYQPSFGELGPAVQILRAEGPPPGTPEAAVVPEKSSSFWVFQRYPDFDREHRGDAYALRFDALEPMYVTGIQVGYDPGVFWVYLGCVLMGAGLFVTFWTVHRRVWARIEPDRVTLAGAAHRNKEVFREEFERLSASLGLAPPRPAGPPEGAT
jgi:cytochrome c biogenesis protein